MITDYALSFLQFMIPYLFSLRRSVMKIAPDLEFQNELFQQQSQIHERLCMFIILYTLLS